MPKGACKFQGCSPEIPKGGLTDATVRRVEEVQMRACAER